MRYNNNIENNKRKEKEITHMKKIDTFYNKKYVCTTTQHKTCREAKESFINKPVWISLVDGVITECKIEDIKPEQVKCRIRH